MSKISGDLTGKFLIAMPGMGDPRFEGAVIYLCDYSDDGAMGLIVNKPVQDPNFISWCMDWKMDLYFGSNWVCGWSW